MPTYFLFQFVVLQRYAVTATYYRKPGPAFLYMNGAGPLHRKYEFSNQVLVYAENLNAICFSLEHRFYGGSKPVNGSVDNHLSSEHALLDIAYFINVVTKEFHLPKDTKWIVFGCSYGGMLAAWSRLKNPHLIHGAVASSSPVLAKVDYFEYEQIIEESLKSYNPNCVECIKSALEEIVHLVDSAETRKNILQMFYFHDDKPRTITRIKKKILHSMLGIISTLVQYNGLHRIPIPLICKIMTEYNGTKLEALAQIKKMYVEFGYNVDITFEKNQNQNIVKDGNKKEDLMWRYQRCSEFGYFSSYANVTFLSGVKHLLMSIHKDIELRCKPLLGPTFSIENVTDKIIQTNSQYGGFNFNVSNTIFIHGSLDPWYKAGLYQKSNASLYETIFIKGTSHCADIREPRDTDILELKNARLEIFNILNSWLSDSTSNHSRN